MGYGRASTAQNLRWKKRSTLCIRPRPLAAACPSSCTWRVQPDGRKGPKGGGIARGSSDAPRTFTFSILKKTCTAPAGSSSRCREHANDVPGLTVAPVPNLPRIRAVACSYSLRQAPRTPPSPRARYFPLPLPPRTCRPPPALAMEQSHLEKDRALPASSESRDRCRTRRPLFQNHPRHPWGRWGSYPCPLRRWLKRPLPWLSVLLLQLPQKRKACSLYFRVTRGPGRSATPSALQWAGARRVVHRTVAQLSVGSLMLSCLLLRFMPGSNLTAERKTSFWPGATCLNIGVY